MDKYHEVKVNSICEKILDLTVDGETYQIDLAQESKRLAEASDTQVNDFSICPAGYGIHWPQVDEDLAIDPMIGIQHEMPKWKVAEDSPQYTTKKDEL